MGALLGIAVDRMQEEPSQPDSREERDGAGRERLPKGPGFPAPEGYSDFGAVVGTPTGRDDYGTTDEFLEDRNRVDEYVDLLRPLNEYDYEEEHIPEIAKQFLFYSSSAGTVVTASFLDLVGHDGEFLRKAAAEGTFWLDFTNPSKEDLATIAKTFSIHPLTIEDIQTPEIQREKCELYRDYLCIATRSVGSLGTSPTFLKPAGLWILVYPTCTLTFHTEAIPHIENGMRKLSKIFDVTERRFKEQITARFQSGWILYLLLNDITELVHPLVRAQEYESDQIEDAMLVVGEKTQTALLRRIHAARKRCTLLLRLMTAKVPVLRAVMKKGGKEWLGGDLGLYFDSLQDRTASMVAHLKGYERNLAGSYSEYLAAINVDVTASSKRLNDIMRKLTGVASVLVPLTLLTSLMGMNVRVPAQHHDTDDLRPFYGILSIMSMLLLYLFRTASRAGWFGDPD
ncbi:CorA metal ion transporter [Rhizophlyctis rosea]|uniref:CorA metal ion transporter n=1 Tax=Rhizophlyctis rosea TaxID=64517 RepID=A0AAD5SIH5_9FUNG|nr:CorA metal ion transporter [Rhizophlyctis rosea]